MDEAARSQDSLILRRASILNRDIDEAIELARNSVINFFADINGDDRRIARGFLFDGLIKAHQLEVLFPSEAKEAIGKLQREWDSQKYWNPIGGVRNTLAEIDGLLRLLPMERQKALLGQPINDKIEVLKQVHTEQQR